jgi:hypothetical protein
MKENDLLAKFQKHLKQQTEGRNEAIKNRDWDQYFSSFNESELLQAFMAVYDQIDDDKEFWRHFCECYKNDDYINKFFMVEAPISHEEGILSLQKHKNQILKILNSKRPHRKNMMTKEEQETLNSMPDIIKIYRGFSLDELENGFSWTTNFKTAEWFTNRTKGDFVLSGHAKKSDVVAYIKGRNEDEILIDPKNVIDKEKVRVSQKNR